jgi:hypothetical protein
VWYDPYRLSNFAGEHGKGVTRLIEGLARKILFWSGFAERKLLFLLLLFDSLSEYDFSGTTPNFLPSFKSPEPVAQFLALSSRGSIHCPQSKEGYPRFKQRSCSSMLVEGPVRAWTSLPC